MNPILPTPVIIKKGQVIVLHDGKKVLLKVTATTDTRYFTASQSIVGTLDEVNSKVAELKLS